MDTVCRRVPALFDFGFQNGAKGVHCVDLGENFPIPIQTSIYLQNLASIQPSTGYQPASQPRTGLSKFAKNWPKVRKMLEKC